MLRLILTAHLFWSVSCLHQSRQKRTWIIDSFNIEEGHPGPFPYELGKIELERAYRVNFDLYGEGVDEDPKGVLTIDKETGIIYVHKPLDHEEKEVLKLRFEASKSDSSVDTKLGVEITVSDINDNPPLFQKSLYEISIREDTAQGEHLLTVLAHDRDQRGTPNSSFHFELQAVSPQTENTQFFMDQDNGKISFRGCLDHEEADKFTLLVEAKDHGDISLSSSTTVVVHIQDGNNHLPVISGQTGSCKVKEGETGTSPLRIHVTDRDTPHSAPWRVTYRVKGHEEEELHFRIETDPETNDGVLTVLTALDYEEVTKLNLTISVENEAPFFSCSIREKTVSTSGLWTVDLLSGDRAAPPLQTLEVTIEVEDMNDPPAFLLKVKEVVLEENSPPGTEVATVTAHDPDSSHARDFGYEVGEDPAGWVKVDRKTGEITTIRVTDRESPHVVDGIYTILIYAVDNGEPPMTGTATVNIHVTDQNDNVPQLEVDIVDMCVSSSSTNISAVDPDGDPFGGPFTFELLGDAQDKWRLLPSYGYTAGLVKDPGVFVGPHEVLLKVLDMQGQSGVYSLSVTVCDCSIAVDCRSRSRSVTSTSAGAVGVLFLALLLLLAGALLTFFVSCKKEFVPLQLQDSEGTTLASDTEEPGRDCKVPLNLQSVSSDNFTIQHDGSQHLISTDLNMEQNFMEQTTLIKHFSEYNEHVSHNFYNSWNEWRNNPYRTLGDLYQQQVSGAHSHFLHNFTSDDAWNEAILALLQRSLVSLEETQNELLDYEPRLYKEEGDSENICDLENICIPEKDSLDTVLLDLSPAFNALALICAEHQKG